MDGLKSAECDCRLANLDLVTGCDSPLDLLCRLGDEEAHSIGWDLGAPGVDGDLGVTSVIWPHLCVNMTSSQISSLRLLASRARSSSFSLTKQSSEA